jgi:hypothetical protein
MLLKQMTRQFALMQCVRSHLTGATVTKEILDSRTRSQFAALENVTWFFRGAKTQ